MIAVYSKLINESLVSGKGSKTVDKELVNNSEVKEFIELAKKIIIEKEKLSSQEQKRLKELFQDKNVQKYIKQAARRYSNTDWIAASGGLAAVGGLSFMHIGTVLSSFSFPVSLPGLLVAALLLITSSKALFIGDMMELKKWRKELNQIINSMNR